MQAIINNVSCGDCGHPMFNWNGTSVHCVNPQCPRYEVSYNLPTVKLEPCQFTPTDAPAAAHAATDITE